MKALSAAVLACLGVGILLGGAAPVRAADDDVLDVEIRALIAKMARDDWAAKQACNEVAQKGKAAVPYLIKALEHPTPRVRYWSISALRSIGDERAVAPIIERLKKDNHPTVRSVAVWHIGEWFKREDVKKAVLEALADEDEDVRTWAMRLIEEKKYTGGVGALKKLLQSEQERTRYGALRAIAALEGEKSIGTLKKALNEDSSPQVRAAAVFHLGEYFDKPEIRDLIVAMLDDKDQLVQGWAMRVVAEKRYKPALPKVMLLVQSDDPDVRYDAINAAVALKGDDSIDMLKRIVKEDSDRDVRECALRACTAIEPPERRCFEVLYEGLSDKDGDLREIAAILMRKGFDQSFGFLPYDTVGNREKAAWRWSAWYRTNKDMLRWDAERRHFVAPEEEKKEGG